METRLMPTESKFLQRGILLNVGLRITSGRQKLMKWEVQMCIYRQQGTTSQSRLNRNTLKFQQNLFVIQFGATEDDCCNIPMLSVGN